MFRKSASSQDIDLLHGPLLGKIFRFALPLMLTNLLQILYSAADMIVVSYSGVEGAVGSIGATHSLVSLLLNLFTGFAVGTSVVVARAIGRGDERGTRRAAHTSVVVSFVMGLICMAAGLTVCRSVLKWMGAEGFVLELSSLYTKIYFLGAPFQALANNFNAILRARGDTRSPMYIMSFTGLVNVVLNLIFVFAFKMDVDGVATATILSQLLSAVMLAVRLSRDKSWVRLSFRNITVDLPSLRAIIREGIPASLQGMMFNISNILIQSGIISLNNMLCPGGSAIIDGNAASNSVEHMLYQACNSVSQATVTFTSQHYGARMYKRLGKVLKNCIIAASIVALAGGGLLLAVRYPLLRMYVSDPVALEAAAERNLVVISTYFLLAFMDVAIYSLRGLGKGFTATVISLSGACVFRIVWLNTVFVAFPTLSVLVASWPASWIVTAAVGFAALFSTRKKLLARTDCTD